MLYSTPLPAFSPSCSITSTMTLGRANEARRHAQEPAGKIIRALLGGENRQGAKGAKDQNDSGLRWRTSIAVSWARVSVVLRFEAGGETQRAMTSNHTNAR